jgi:ArsR family transcriptional regulator, arsenate/arsenite/antimonite-responsive transcriptional repressor
LKFSMKQPIPHPLSPDVLSPVADYFKVLSETSRLQILNCLHEGPMNVMELTEATGYSQANLSKHLKIMTQVGILSRQPKGVSAYYEIADPKVFELCKVVRDSIGDRFRQQAQPFQLHDLSNR